MSELSLDFFGVRGRLACSDAGVLDELRRDFAYFEADGDPPHFRATLNLGPIARSAIPDARPFLRRRHFSAYDRDGRRIVDHNGRALTNLDYAAETAEIFSEDPALLRELGYLLICSRAGYLLDLKGFHRVHSLGLAYRGMGVIVLLPSGGGKTRLCLDVLRSGKAKLLSEDTPLLGPDGRLWPFPLRLGLQPAEDRSGIPPQFCRELSRSRHGPKVLVDLPFFKDALSGPVKPGLVVAGKRSKEDLPKAGRRSRLAAAAPLLTSLVVGAGTPQLTEYMLRKDAAGIKALAGIALRRAAAMASLIRGCPAVSLSFGTQRRANLEELLRLMDQAFLQEV
ncbi:MAG: hypothetical protein HY077_07715 [Elusimicrobia bacterium]|nr:hypothetical protein [Elusimicrobiota bacterium]